MPSSKLRGDLSKASHEQRVKQNQQRWRSGYDRKQASIQPSFCFPRRGRGARSTHTTLLYEVPCGLQGPSPGLPFSTLTWQCQPTRQTKSADRHILAWIPGFPAPVEDPAAQSSLGDSPFSSSWSSNSSFNPKLPCWDFMPFHLIFFLNEIQSLSAKWLIEG